MKIAFCISGLFKPSTTYSTAYQNKFEYLVEKIKKYNADVFIFSFSKELESEIIEIFKPKKFKFEEQKLFNVEINKINNQLNKQAAKNLFSSFYSRKMACALKTQFENVNNIKYDIIVSCRPDLGYINTENFEIPDLNKINPEYLYSIYWNQLNAGLADWYFISNSENINFISSIYDKLPEYLNENSKYQNCLLNGFPYSNSKNRFSQEIFQKDPEHSEKINSEYILNHHLLIKYFLLENDKFSLNFLKFFNS